MKRINPPLPHKKFPCKKCITLPICIAIFKQGVADDILSSVRPVRALSNNCSILNDYILERHHDYMIQVFYESRDRRMAIYRYFYKRIHNKD